MQDEILVKKTHNCIPDSRAGRGVIIFTEIKQRDTARTLTEN